MKRGTFEQITSQIEPTTSNIILGAYGTGPRPIIELHNVSSTETAVIFMDDIIGWTIKDLEIKSTDTTVYPATASSTRSITF